MTLVGGVLVSKFHLYNCNFSHIGDTFYPHRETLQTYNSTCAFRNCVSFLQVVPHTLDYRYKLELFNTHATRSTTEK